MVRDIDDGEVRNTLRDQILENFDAAIGDGDDHGLAVTVKNLGARNHEANSVSVGDVGSTSSGTLRFAHSLSLSHSS